MTRFAAPPSIEVRGRMLDFAQRTYLMAVVNVTPDSFSDGGRYLAPEAAIAHALRLCEEGADLVDIGGESTRPGGAASVSAAEELRRVLPVVRGLRSRSDVPISIDTYKAAVAHAALEAGADLVNDISGLRLDPEMAATVARHQAPVVLMHSRGDAASLHREPAYRDVTLEVAAELEAAIGRAVAAGIAPERIILDPGLGFAKAPAHNLPLLADLGPVLRLRRPVLVGASRKSFLGAITGRPVEARGAATAAATVAAVLAGAHLIRVHEVASLLDAVRVADAIRRQRLGGDR